MRIRPQKKNAKLKWVVDYRDRTGKRHQKFYDTKEQAIQEGTRLRLENRTLEASQQTPVENARELYDVAGFLNSYLHHTQGRRSPKSQRNRIYRFRSFLGFVRTLGIQRVTDITEVVVSHYKAWLDQEQHLTPATIRSYLIPLKAAFRWGVQNDLLLEDPAKAVPLPRIDRRGRTRFLSKDEITELLSDLSEQESYLHGPAAAAIYAGLRRSECVHLKKEDVNLDRDLITVSSETSKGNKARFIKMHSELTPILRTCISATDDHFEYVFASPEGHRMYPDNLTHDFTDAARVMGFDDVSFHTLRHTFASQLAMTGKYSLHQIAALLGHSDTRVTQLYAHLLPDQIEVNF